MTATYRDLSEIPLEDLQQLLQLLQDVQVAPADLLSYALAVDLVAEAEENGVSVEDAYFMDLEAERDDPSMAEAYAQVTLQCLIKMGEVS